MFLRLAISLVCLLLAGTSAGQSENILKLKNKPYYSERNQYSSDSSVVLIQEVCYNKPLTIDDEFCMILKIRFLDPLKARELKRLTINKDSSIIQYSFAFQSVWNWGDRNTISTGSITILKWKTNSVKLRLDLQILDQGREKTYTYFGDRTFTLKPHK